VQRMTCGAYLERYRGRAPLDQQHTRVAHTLNIEGLCTAWKQEGRGGQAPEQLPRHLLELCAHLAPESIPSALLCAWLGRYGVSGGNAEWLLSAVVRLSLVQPSSESEHVNMHRVVQKALRDQLAAPARAHVVRVLAPLNELLTYDEHVEASWARVGRWYAHVASVCGHVQPWVQGQHQVADECVEDLARALQTCGQWQHHIGQFGAAE